MSSVCMKYPICSETKGALLLKFRFHTPPPLPPARPPDTLPSSHAAQPAGDRAGSRRQAGSGGRSPGTARPCVLGCRFWLQVRGGLGRGEQGLPGERCLRGPRGGQRRNGGQGGPSRGRRWGRDPGRAPLSGTEMPALLLTETTCVSRQRDRDAAKPGAWGLGPGTWGWRAGGDAGWPSVWCAPGCMCARGPPPEGLGSFAFIQVRACQRV